MSCKVLKRILPDGYTQLEYIQSTTSITTINTGIILDQTCKIEAKFNVQNNNGIFLYGSREAYTVNAMGCFNQWAPFGTDGGSEYITISTDTDTVIEQSQAGIYKDGVLQRSYTTQTFTTPLPCIIFACHQGTTPHTYYSNRSAFAKCYYFKIWKNNVLVFNGIPCKNSSNVVGMYDTVSNTFLGNYEENGNVFIAGPETHDLLDVKKFYFYDGNLIQLVSKLYKANAAGTGVERIF